MRGRSGTRGTVWSSLDKVPGGFAQERTLRWTGLDGACDVVECRGPMGGTGGRRESLVSASSGMAALTQRLCLSGHWDYLGLRKRAVPRPHLQSF